MLLFCMLFEGKCYIKYDYDSTAEHFLTISRRFIKKYLNVVYAHKIKQCGASWCVDACGSILLVREEERMDFALLLHLYHLVCVAFD